MGCPHLAEDDHYSSRDNRKLHRQALTAELDPCLAQKSAAKWEQELTALGVPVGVVMSVSDILAHPHIAHRGVLAEFKDVPGAGACLSVLRTGFQTDGQPAAVDTPPPVIGQHNHELLSELGYDDDVIAHIQAGGRDMTDVADWWQTAIIDMEPWAD